MREAIRDKLIFIAGIILLIGGTAAISYAPRPHCDRPAKRACRVIRVVDGDTFDADCGGRRPLRVRMLRIDAPERDEYGYGMAAAALRGLAEGEEVLLQDEEPGLPRCGHYGRRLAYVRRVRDGRDLNLAMIRSGMARWYVKYGWGTRWTRYLPAEIAACALERGLWGHPLVEWTPAASLITGGVR